MRVFFTVVGGNTESLNQDSGNGETFADSY